MCFRSLLREMSYFLFHLQSIIIINEGFQKDLKSNRLIITLVRASEFSLQPHCV